MSQKERETEARARPLHPLLPLLVLAAWLTWRGPAALAGLATELAEVDPARVLLLLRLGEAERMAAALRRLDREDGLASGYHQELLAALEARVEPSGVVLLARRLGKSKGRALASLNSLAAPRTLRVLGADAGRVLAEETDAWVLDFRAELRAFLGPERKALAEGPDWVLWR
jgi:hypothetical protein